MNHKIDFNKATFIKSASHMNDLPTTPGAEVAFVGRSNAGKSSALNAVSGVNGLARISKTPGRTQLINLFQVPCNVDTNYYLVDLPGYGYAKVPHKVKLDWQQLLAEYLETRECLRGVILLIDIRHELKPLDLQMIEWCKHQELALRILLTKADKLSFGQAKIALMQTQKALNLTTAADSASELISVQLFSAHNKLGIDEARNIINSWFTS